jgi:hypothetical protein
VEGSVELNQVIARIAKQMCLAEPAKESSHRPLLQVGIARCEPPLRLALERTGSLSGLRL